VTSNRFIPAARLHLLTPVYDALCSARSGLAIACAGSRWRMFRQSHAERFLRSAAVRLGSSPRSAGAIPRRLSSLQTSIRTSSSWLARKRLARGGLSARFIRASAERLPLTDASCDLVLSSLMFHHLPSRTKRAALREWRRVLKDGGELLLFDFGVPRSRLTRILFWPLRFHLLEEQADNLRGLVPGMLAEGGARIRGNRRLRLGDRCVPGQAWAGQHPVACDASSALARRRCATFALTGDRIPMEA
jgi:SAM-dependent methyltransferase